VDAPPAASRRRSPYWSRRYCDLTQLRQNRLRKKGRAKSGAGANDIHRLQHRARRGNRDEAGGNGQQLKCLIVTDEFTKEGLAIDVDARIRSARAVDVLSRLISPRGAPAFLRSDKGPEFVSTALLSWVIAQGTGTALIEPGKPGRMASPKDATAITTTSA
jgi:Integrase core domain